MIKAAVAELPICLRCQYRAIQARTKLLWRKGGQSECHARGFKQWANLLESQAAAVMKDYDHDNVSKEQEEQLAFDGARSVVIYRHVRSSPGPRRRRRQAKKESLGLESLGTPAEALVLEEQRTDTFQPGVFAHRAAPEDDEEGEGGIFTPDDLMGEFDSGEGREVADIDQACSNIDLLRPPNSRNKRHDLGNKEYDNLHDSLTQGFQKVHLVHYLERTPPKTSTDPSDIHKPFSSEHYARSAWTPSMFSEPKRYKMPRLGAIQEDIPSRSPARSWKSMQKSALAEAVIESCWNLRRHQPTSLKGTLFLRLQPARLQLLLDHPRNPLKHVGEIFHTKMEAYRKTGVIRIVSNFTVTKEVLGVLTQLCDSIGSTTVKLSSEAGPESDQALSDDYLLQVATSTNTVIYRNDKFRETCTVLYLGPETTDRDDAERLLRYRVDSVTGHAGQSKEYLLYNPSSEPVCLAPIEHRESLPVADRSIAWGRIAHPITSVTDTEASKLHKTHVNIMRGPQAAAKRLIDFLLSKPHNPVSPGQDPKHWTKGLSASTSAILGHAAFQVRDSESHFNSLGSETFLQDKPGTNGVFIPFVPGSMRSFDTFDVDPETFEATEGTGTSEALRLKMIPDPGALSELPQPWATTLPTLDIEIGIDRETGATSFKWARFVVHDSVMNFMLPMRMLDIQFSRKSFLVNNAENTDPSLLDFVDVSSLDILRSEALRTPNHLHIQVPGHALREVQDIDQSIFKNGLQMRYAFSNLEYRSSMKLRVPPRDKQSRKQIVPFSDHHVTFTHVEAGRLGGSREELVIHDLGDMISADEDDGRNVSDAVGDEEPTIDINRLQSIERTPDGSEWIQKAHSLGSRGRARRLLKAALAVAGSVEPRQSGGLEKREK